MDPDSYFNEPGVDTSSQAPSSGSQIARNQSDTSKKRGRGKSIVWQHMSEKFEVDVDGVKKPYVRCNYCNEELAADTVRNGTSALRKHLFQTCKGGGSPLLQKKSKVGSSQTTMSPDTLATAMGFHNFNQKRCELKCIRFIIKDELPFRAVEKSGIKEFMYELQPRFKQPNRKKVAAGVWDLFVAEKEKMKDVIKGKKVSITTDTWTSIQNINYMVVTAHFMDDEWKLHKRIINFTHITSHKGEDIGKALEACLSSWGIDQVFSITVDNASANDGAIEYMKKRFKAIGTLMLKGKYMHMRCGCHILNLIVGDGIKELQGAIESIRNCAKYIHMSPQRLGKFREVCVLFNKDRMSNVPLDVPTRWNSTFKLLEAAIKYRSVFTRMAETDVPFAQYFVDKVGPPTDEDWDNAIGFAHFLSTFHKATLKLSATTTPTSNLLFAELVGIQVEIEKAMHKAGDQVLQRVPCSMKVKFDKYWGSFDMVNSLMYVAIALDPRYKLAMIEICYKMLNASQETINRVCDGVKKCLYELYKEYSKGGTSSSRVTPNVDEDDEFRAPIDSGGSGLQAILEELTKEKRAGQLLEFSNEVDKYLHDPSESHAQVDFDICLWWNANKTKYPTLALVAHDVLAIPTSTVASENAFSLGGRVVDPFMASLTLKMVEALVCSNDWLKAEEFSLYKEPTEDELEFYKELEELEVTGCVSTSPVVHDTSNTATSGGVSGSGLPPLPPHHF